MIDPVQVEIGKALTSSFGSSFKELSELFADKIRYLRWQSAVRTLEKAKKFAAPYGDLKQVPPLKFFLPFMENCSLEEDDKELTDMWARLLASASNEFKPGHLLYMRILKEITGDEARLLIKLANSKFKAHYDNHLEEAIHHWESLSSPVSALVDLDLTVNWDNIKEIIRLKHESRGVAIDWLSLAKIDQEPQQELENLWAKETKLFLHSNLSREILIALNLIRFIPQKFTDKQRKYSIEGAAYCLTPLGSSFYETCVE